MIKVIISFILVIILFVGSLMSFYPRLFINKADYGNVKKIKQIKFFGTILFYVMIIVLFIIY